MTSFIFTNATIGTQMASQIQGLKKVAAANRNKAKSQLREAPPNGANTQQNSHNGLVRRASKGNASHELRISSNMKMNSNRIDLMIEHQNRAANS